MLIVQTVRLPDGTTYAAINNGKTAKLYQQRPDGDWEIVLEPVLGSWSWDTIQLEQISL